MPWTEFHHLNADALAAAVALRISESLDRALAERGAALLALAGGRTSPPVFQRLAAQARAWSRVSVLPSDERWVARDHADCNLRQMQQAFAGAEGIRWLPLVPGNPDGPADAGYANAQLAAHPEAFDLCLLGMGADGHFASLFPGAPTLPAALNLHTTASALAIMPNPMPAAGPHARVSLTLPRLLHARRVLLAITGADKLAVLRTAQESGAASGLPVAALLHAPGTVVEVHYSP